MRAICITLIAVLLVCFDADAQKIPQERLDKIIKDFAKDGYTMERIYAPDFNSPSPNTPSRFVPCYTGKTVMVAAIMAFKPQNLQFKVLLGGKEAPKTHEPENLSTNGENLFYDYRALKFGPKYVSTNQNCLNIVLFDKGAASKAIYTIIFTKANK